MDRTPTSQENIKDRCPTWAVALIARIRDIEIEAGNINPPGGDWAQRRLEEIQERAYVEHEGKDDAEELFVELSRRLSSEGFSPAEIAGFVNARILSGGRLPYCSAAEVSEALLP